MSRHSVRRGFLTALLALALSCSRSGPLPAPPGSTPSPLQAIREKHGVPALGALVLQDGRSHGFVDGVRKRGDPTAATMADAFHLGSCTKAMTATLVALFIQRGQLRWDSRIEELFPEWAPELDPQLKRVTVEMLTSHRAGFSHDAGMSFVSRLLSRFVTSDAPPREERQKFARQVLSSAPQHAPGSRFEYSNTGYILAGAILEKLSGKSWETLMQEELFKPLGMTSCGFGVPGQRDLSHPVQPWPHRAGFRTQPIFDDNPEMMGPAGTAHCSMEDWAKFVQLHLDGINRKASALLSPEHARKLYEHPPDQGYTYGGWDRLKRDWAGGDVLQHSGSNGLNYAVVWVAPHKNTAFLGVANIGGEEAQKATNEAVSMLLNETSLAPKK